jgi:hypothetical protein
MRARSSTRSVFAQIPEEFLPRKLTQKQQTFAPQDSTKSQSGPRSQPESQPRSQPHSRPQSQPQSQPHSKPASRPRSQPTSQPQSAHEEEEQSPRCENALTDPEAIELREELIETHDFSHLPEEKLILLIAHLKEYKREVAASGDYDEARRAKSLYDEAYSTYSHREHERTTRTSPRERYLEGRRAQEDRWRSEVEEFDAETEERLEQLRKKHELEANEFELRWQEEETLRRYHKPSSRLLQMWRMEKFLARSEEYDNAEVIRAESRELTKRELGMGQAMANRDFAMGREQLRQRQQSEWDFLVNTRQHWKEVMLGRHKCQKQKWAIKDTASMLRSSVLHGGHEPLLPGKTRAPAPKKTWPGRASISFEFRTVLPSIRPPGEPEKGKSGGGSAEQGKETSDRAPEQEGEVAGDKTGNETEMIE